MNASARIEIAPSSKDLQTVLREKIPNVEVTFVEVPAIVDSEVDTFEMKNPPKSRTGAPLNKCGKLTAAGESD